MHLIIYLLNICHHIMWQAYGKMLYAAPTLNTYSGADFDKGFREEMILQLYLGGRREGVSSR